jgi:hypothetical protein
MARITVCPTQLDRNRARYCAAHRPSRRTSNGGSYVGCRRACAHRSRSRGVAPHPQIRGARSSAKHPCAGMLSGNGHPAACLKPSSSRSDPTAVPSRPPAWRSIFRQMVGRVSLRSRPACRRSGVRCDAMAQFLLPRGWSCWPIGSLTCWPALVLASPWSMFRYMTRPTPIHARRRGGSL